MLRSYTSVFVYDRPGHEVARAELPPQPQGESVAADGDRLLVGSEGPESQVLAVPVPGGAKPAATRTGTSAPTTLPATEADDGRSATWGLRVVARRRRCSPVSWSLLRRQRR